MAQESQTWINPRPGHGDLELILNSLSTWLANPTFPNGVTLGNGTPATFSSATGAMTAPAVAQLLTAATIPGQLAFEYDGTNLNVYFGGTLVLALS